MSASLLRQLAPLKLDPETDEPFLRLPAPHTHIIITPPRMSDAQRIVDYFNDPRIFRWTVSPPWPYYLQHAYFWLEMTKAETDAALKQLEDAAAKPDGGQALALTHRCPVRSIREKRPDGTDVFLGDCSFMASTFEWVLCEKARAQLVEENIARPHGSPDFVWSIGDYLAPSHHGQGIMTAVVRALIEHWAVPRMNVKCIRPIIFDGNEGSLRVFYKNGFILWKTVPNAMLSKAKGDFIEETRTIHVVDYKPQENQ